ncbi:MAG: hypothetical protein ACYS8Z_18500 [Planctomycetota bacterium]|jgi:uncharacterized protein YjeT (DUF2065 family)
MTAKDLIRLIGVICVIAGIIYNIRPDIPKRLIAFVAKGRRIYLAGILRFAMAVVFLVGAGDCRHKWVIVIFGIGFLISGLLAFMLGPKRFGPILTWFTKQPNMIIRILGAVALAIGAVICWCA